MEIDRPVVTGPAEQRDHTLAFAQRINADQMGPVREYSACDRSTLSISSPSGGMAKDRQAERRLGDKDIAGHDLERRACRIGAALVIARDDHPAAASTPSPPGRYPARGLQAQAIAARHRSSTGLTIFQCLGFADAVAVARFHDRECAGRRQHMLVARPRMIGMAMG